MRRLAAASAAALLFLASVAAAATAPASALPPLPADSLLQISGSFTDQSQHRFTLTARRGTPQLVSMFYGSCQAVCPLLIETGTAIARALSPAERSRLKFLLVSFDPARDTSAALAAIAREHHVDSAYWTLARADDAVVRKLAAALDMRYRRLANGDFNHSTVWVLLDADGRMLARTEELSLTPDPKFLAAVRAALR